MSGQAMNVSLVLKLVDQFSDRSRKITSAFDRMGSRGQSAMRMIRVSSLEASNALDRLGNRYTALATGALGTGAIRGVVQLQRRLIMLGITANETGENIGKLKDELFAIANQKDIMIDPSQILDAIDSIVEKTGDLKMAQDNMRNIGMAIRATGAQGVDIGGLLSDLSQKFGIDQAQDMLKTLDLLTNQGKAGAFTMKDLASQGPRVTAAYAATGRVGQTAVREMGAMLQMIRQSVGSPEQAATAFEAMLRNLQDAQKRKILVKGGIKLIDPQDPKRMRDVGEIIKDIVKKTGGDNTKLRRIFDDEGIRAVNSFAIQYKNTGNFGSYDSFYKQRADGAQINGDAARAAVGLDAAATKLGNVGKKYAFNNLSGPLKAISVAIQDMDEKKLERILGLLANGALLLGGGIVLNKAVRGGVGAVGMFKKLGQSAIGGAAAKIAPQPVIVMNWPGGVGTGQLALPAPARAAGGKLGMLGMAGRFATPLFMTVNGGALAYGMYSGKKQTELAAAGRFAGFFPGMAAGAAIGSVLPGPGTAIGGLIGGAVGAIGGGMIGSRVGASSDARRAALGQPLDVGGRIDIHLVDGGVGRISAQSNDPRVKYDTHTGKTMGGMW